MNYQLKVKRNYKKSIDSNFDEWQIIQVNNLNLIDDFLNEFGFILIEIIKTERSKKDE